MAHGVDRKFSSLCAMGYITSSLILPPSPRQDLSTSSSTALGRETCRRAHVESLGPNGGSLEVLRSSRPGSSRRGRRFCGSRMNKSYRKSETLNDSMQRPARSAQSIDPLFYFRIIFQRRSVVCFQPAVNNQRAPTSPMFTMSKRSHPVNISGRI